MPTLTLREGLGRPLTYEEMDDNLRFVEDRAQEASSNAGSAAQSAQSAEDRAQEASSNAGSAAQSAQSAEADRQHVDQQRQAVDAAAQSASESASTAQYWAEQAQDIVTDGVIDDSGPSEVTTYSSEHIEAKLEGKAPSNHNHNHSDIEGLGTAATRDVGTNAGNVMEVGAFGLGTNGRQRENIDELGQESGIYRFSTGAEGTFPTSNPNGTLALHMAWDQNTQAQIAYSHSPGGLHWRRAGSTIDPWVELYHTGNIASSRLDLMTATYTSSTSTAGINTSASAVIRVNASANRTLALNNPPANNRAQVLTVLLTGSTGTITWPSSIRWSGGYAPDLMASWTAVTLMWAGDGYWYGFVSGGAD